MRILFIGASALAAVAVATPAMAQDSSDRPFTGARAEGVVGWDHVKAGGGGGSDDGVVFGGQLGYDFQTDGGLVIGAEGEITGATTKDTTTDLLVAGDSFRVKAGRDLYAGARVGAVVGSNTLLYGKLGYTNARVNTRYISGGTTTTDGENLDGWRAGAGVEFKLGSNMYAKGEYRFSKYGDISGTNVDLKRHQVVGGIGVRF